MATLTEISAHIDPSTDHRDSPPSERQRGHHVEFYVWSGESPVTARLEEAERWRAAGIPGDIAVYSVNLLLLKGAAVQVKGGLSWKLRESHDKPAAVASNDSSNDGLIADSDRALST